MKYHQGQNGNKHTDTSTTVPLKVNFENFIRYFENLQEIIAGGTENKELTILKIRQLLSFLALFCDFE